MYNAATRLVTNTSASISVDTTAGGTQLVAALTGKKVRKSLLITNMDATNACFVAIGFNPTSTAYNYRLAAQTTIAIPAGIQEQIKGLSASGTISIRVLESV